jgi:diguanylate cyclase (GGDEF)-like protein
MTSLGSLLNEGSENPQLHLPALVVREAQIGLMVLDQEERIVLFNNWLARAANLSEKDALGRGLLSMFPELIGSRLQSAVEISLQKGFPALLSQSLNRSPLPLFAGEQERDLGVRMEQQIQVIPLRSGETRRYCLIQITNVSAAVKRETMLLKQAKELKHNLIIDGLTGVYSRRYWEEQTVIEFRKARRACFPVAIIMLDVDLFKNYNDAYGHPAGDHCLTCVAKAAANAMKRPRDILARYGGEEFVALLPETNLQGAQIVAKRILKSVENLNIHHMNSDVAPHVTVSVGVSCGLPSEGESQKKILSAADRALYTAKHRGRNQVVLCTDQGFFTLDTIQIDNCMLGRRHE